MTARPACGPSTAPAGTARTPDRAGFFQGLFYLQYEDRPAAAQPILDRLRERYPRNLYFTTMAAYARQRQRRFEAARPIYESVLRQLSGTRVYGREGESITRLLYGQTLMALGGYDAAAEQFVRVVRPGIGVGRLPARVSLLGRLADLGGNRAVAETYYRKVLSLPDAAGSRAAAERYMERPLRRGRSRRWWAVRPPRPDSVLSQDTKPTRSSRRFPSVPPAAPSSCSESGFRLRRWRPA